MTIFVRPQRNSWKSSFRPDWPNFENFKLGPRAQFLANRPNSFFVDHIDTRSLGGIHHWASRGTAGRELKCGHIVPLPALDNLDQRPLYIGLRKKYWNITFQTQSPLTRSLRKGKVFPSKVLAVRTVGQILHLGVVEADLGDIQTPPRREHSQEKRKNK